MQVTPPPVLQDFHQYRIENWQSIFEIIQTLQSIEQMDLDDAQNDLARVEARDQELALRFERIRMEMDPAVLQLLIETECLPGDEASE